MLSVKKRICLGWVALASLGCVQVERTGLLGFRIRPGNISTEAQGYLNRVEQQPLTFYMPEQEAEEAWGRAGDWFIRGFSDTRLTSATSDMLETSSPISSQRHAYNVTRTRSDNGFQFSVRCETGGKTGSSESWHNARILAHFIATGELRPEWIDK